MHRSPVSIIAISNVTSKLINLKHDTEAKEIRRIHTYLSTVAVYKCFQLGTKKFRLASLAASFKRHGQRKYIAQPVLGSQIQYFVCWPK